MISFEEAHLIRANAERADIEAWEMADAKLLAARPRPAAPNPARAGFIRGLAFGGAVLVVVVMLAHVVLADPLARLAIDAERGRAEYCGRC